MSQVLPIGVVVPTRNSRAMLPHHLAGMAAWLDLAAEVVVVDSYSEDGTLEYLRRQLHHPQAQFLSHPPGLYASWNFGISQVSSQYCYISTVGDPISRSGLEHLFRVAEQFHADVVLSKPDFVTEAGRRLADKRWTIHDFLDHHALRSPARAQRAHVFLTSVFYGLAGFMGSSASNLYRTATLRQRPFPTDHGHMGDTAWGIAHAFGVDVAVTPEPCAQFLIHPSAGQMTEEEEQLHERALLELTHRTLTEGLAAGLLPPQARDLGNVINAFEAAKRLLRAADHCYYAHRRRLFPWFLNPWAWQARHERNHHRAAIHQMWAEALAVFTF